MRHFGRLFFAFFGISFTLSTFVHAQSWSGILSSSRAINWTNVGLPSTFTDKGGSNVETTTNPWTPPTRTQYGSTINPSGSASTDLSNINTALSNCSDGQYVLLGSGTFLIQGTIVMYQHSCTLRGSGAQSTTLNLSGSGVIFVGASGGGGSITLTSSPAAGATSLAGGSLSGPAPAVGDIAELNQCDTGYSGSGCTGSTADNGALYVCGDNLACMTDSPASGSQNHQVQTVAITSVSSSSGSYTIGVSPAIFMPNWSTSQNATLGWNSPTYNAVGVGLEDMTVYANGISSNWPIQVQNAYASWVKGIRLIGSGTSATLSVQNAIDSIAVNDYFFSAYPSGGYTPWQLSGSTQFLFMNNILTSGAYWMGIGGNVGNVLAYNLVRDMFTLYTENSFFDHHAFDSFDLFEGNEVGVEHEDDTWGTHALDTHFRDYVACTDGPYTTFSQGTGNNRGIVVSSYQRFHNLIGNAIGTSGVCTSYQGSTYGNVFQFDGSDSMVSASLMRWGNVTVVQQSTDTPANSGVRFVSSEVPSSINPNSFCTASGTPYSGCTGSGTGTISASAWNNPVPSTNSLPCSFFMPSYTNTTCAIKPNGGTGLSWWKICTAWGTFPSSCSTSQTQPFPPNGPDQSGGPHVNGYAYDNPAFVAWESLPVDTTYQSSYTITGSSWSSDIETLTVSGLPNVENLLGAFELSGVDSACTTGATFNAKSEILMTGSSSTTISYTLPANPGTSCTGTFLFPDIRQFDERVYEADSTVQPAAPIGLSGSPVPLP